MLKARRDFLERALKRSGGNVAAAARAVSMNRTYLAALIQRGQVSLPPARVTRSGNRGNQAWQELRA